MNRSRLFAVLFLLSAFSASLWMFRQIPHPLTLHINHNWHLALIGEQDLDSLRYRPEDFRIEKQDPANLWLTGEGTVHWNQYSIVVSENRLRFNKHRIERSDRHLDISLLVYPDGRITKGPAQLSEP